MHYPSNTTTAAVPAVPGPALGQCTFINNSDSGSGSGSGMRYLAFTKVFSIMPDVT